MPEEKKNQQKGRNDPKDQRRPRQGRHKAGPVEKQAPIAEKKSEGPKVTVPQKPVYQDPGPEFYQNLKRETDEILKITEEANSKYKKKEIQSNWTKYEMPIESYDEIEEKEDMGADYEKLIQMPLSVGGHFQFKHEKSWDISTGPSLYDKYFDINMNELANALYTIPFYDRNNIDKFNFNQIDIMTMENRATKYKQKYFNDKSYTTPELEAQDKILSHFKEAVSKPEPDEQDIEREIKFMEKDKLSPETKIIHETSPLTENDQMESQLENKETEIVSDTMNIIKQDNIQVVNNIPLKTVKTDAGIDDVDELFENIDSPQKEPEFKEVDIAPAKEIVPEVTVTEPTMLEVSKIESTNNPVIESPEDLEKWLDDFLDG